MNLLPAAAVEGILRWIVDCYLLATLALGLALVAGRWMRQAVRRLTLAWTTLVGLALLAVVCAMPGWPRVSLGWLAPADRTQPAEAKLTERVATVAEHAALVPPPRDVRPEPKRHGDHPTRNVAARDAGPDNRRSNSEPAPTATVAPADQARSVRPIPAVIVGLFLAGVCLAVAWLAWGALATMRLCRRATPAPAALVAQLARIVGPARPPRLLLSRRIGSAAALGLLRPTIILPAAIIGDGAEDGAADAPDRQRVGSLRAVLAHEWAHIRNRDLWLLALGRGLFPLLLAHPLFWWLRKKIRDDQETVADAVAARDNRPDYAAELLHWVRRTAGPPPLPISAALGIWERPSQLTRRIAMLLDENFQVQTRATRRWRIGSAAAVAAVGLVLSMLTIQAAPPVARPEAGPANAAAAVAVNSGIGPVIEVSASYPGATALVVSDTIAVPIEFQINGVEGTVWIESECHRDGRYIARVHFGPRVDPQSAASLVQKRVELATPLLPAAVKLAGVSVNVASDSATKQRPAIALEDREDKGRDALRRWAAAVEKRLVVEGAAVQPEEYPGPDEKQLHLNIDREKLAARGISVSAVFEAIRAAGPTPTTEALKNLTVPASDGNKVPLGSVAEIREEMGPSAIYRVNLYPAIRISGAPPEGKSADEAVANWLEIAAAERPSGFAAESLIGSQAGLVAFNPGEGQAAAPSDKNADANAAAPKPLPADVVQAWEKAGAQAGWIGIDERGRLAFHRVAEGRPGEIPAFKFSEWQAGVVARLPQPPQAFGLDLSYTGVTDAGLRELAGLKTLQTLSLRNCQKLTDAGLNELAGLRTLQVLILANCEQLTGAGLKELAGLNRLKTLDLSVTKVTDSGLTGLAGAQTLQSLYLGVTQVTDAGLKHLAGLKNLQMLVLFDTQVTDAGIKALAGLRNLQTLNLSSTRVTDAGLKELAGLENLQSLTILKTHVTDAGLKELAGLKNLKTLELEQTSVTGTGLKELSGLKNFRSLNLHSAQVTDAGLKGIADVKSLRTLTLKFCGKVTDAGMKEIARLSSLESLDITGTQATDVGLTELTALKNLRSLGLWGTQITDRGLKELAVLKNLHELDFNGTKVTDAGLKELAGLKSLESLDFSFTQVTDAGLTQLAGLKNLQELDLSFTQVTDAGLKQLAGLTNLQALILNGDQVTDMGLKQLAGLKGLEVLDLYRTQVTDVGMKELAGLTSLRFLNLCATKVSDVGLKELAGLKNLESVWLEQAQATGAGVKWLRQKLPNCQIDRGILE